MFMLLQQGLTRNNHNACIPSTLAVATAMTSIAFLRITIHRSFESQRVAFKSHFTRYILRAKWYVLPKIRHRYPIAITEDDPTRQQLPRGGLFSGRTPPKWLAVRQLKKLSTVASSVAFLMNRETEGRSNIAIYTQRFLVLSHIEDGHSVGARAAPAILYAACLPKVKPT
jgi:hypothetical protein